MGKFWFLLEFSDEFYKIRTWNALKKSISCFIRQFPTQEFPSCYKSPSHATPTNKNNAFYVIPLTPTPLSNSTLIGSILQILIKKTR